MIGIKTFARMVPNRIRPAWRRTYSQEGEDIVLNTLFGYTEPGVYVDIGAHDPVLWSNTKKFAELGWWGLNIDPMPGTAERFRRLRPRDICMEAAIDIGAGADLSYWMFDHEPRWNCLATTPPLNFRDGQTFHPSRSIAVPTITIREALERASLPRVDLLNLDIEGGEEYILRHWPWDLHRPRAICVEIIGQPAAEIAALPLTAFLAEQGLVFASQMIASIIYVERAFLFSRYPRPNAPEAMRSQDVAA